MVEPVAEIFSARSVVRPGEQLEVMAATASERVIKVVRHGLEALELATKRCSATPRVPEWNDASAAPSWDRLADFSTDSWRPGLYSVQLCDEAGAVLQAHPFVVEGSTTAAHCGLLVVANVSTWHMYNAAGGRSRYFNAGIARSEANGSQRAQAKLLLKETLIRRFPRRVMRRSPRWMFDPLSTERPFHAPGLVGEPSDLAEDHLAGAEWKLLAWLEREGIDYRIVADQNVGRALEEGWADTLLLSGHSEYWTINAIDALRDAHYSGLRLANLSGNSLAGSVEYEDNRIRCTSTHLESQMDLPPAEELFGVRTEMRNVNSCAPIRIVDGAVFGNRVGLVGRSSLVGANLERKRNALSPSSAGNGFAQLTGQGGSGWEVDTPLRSSPSGFELVAEGTNRFGGAPILLGTARPADVLAAPSITFGGTLLLDAELGQIVRKFLVG